MLERCLIHRITLLFYIRNPVVLQKRILSRMRSYKYKKSINVTESSFEQKLNMPISSKSKQQMNKRMFIALYFLCIVSFHGEAFY